MRNTSIEIGIDVKRCDDCVEFINMQIYKIRYTAFGFGLVAGVVTCAIIVVFGWWMSNCSL